MHTSQHENYVICKESGEIRKPNLTPGQRVYLSLVIVGLPGKLEPTRRYYTYFQPKSQDVPGDKGFRYRIAKKQRKQSVDCWPSSRSETEIPRYSINVRCSNNCGSGLAGSVRRKRRGEEWNSGEETGNEGRRGARRCWEGRWKEEGGRERERERKPRSTRAINRRVT